MSRAPLPLAFLLVWLTTLASSAVGGAPQALGASEIQPPNTSGTAFLGYSEKPNQLFRVQLSTANSHVAVLYVGGGPLRELPSQEWTKYAVRPRRALAGGTLRANFGSIGSISLRFEPTGETKLGRLPDHCTGPRPHRESGVYRGSISLRGENGYFRLHRLAAKGRRIRTFRLVCDPGYATDPAAEVPLTGYVAPRLSSSGNVHAQLETISESTGLSTGFLASKASGDSFGALRSSVIESLPEMAIGRYSYFAGPTIFQTFAPGPGLLNAALGSTTYNRDQALPETWSDELITSFPGGRRVVLNGPDSRTRLCLYDRSVAPSECVGEPNPLLPEGPFDPLVEGQLQKPDSERTPETQNRRL